MYLKSSQYFCDIHPNQNFATLLVSVHASDNPHFATLNHTHRIANFKIHKLSQNTLRLTRHRNLAIIDASHFGFEYVSQTSSQIFTKVSGVGHIASCDVS